MSATDGIVLVIIGQFGSALIGLSLKKIIELLGIMG